MTVPKLSGAIDASDFGYVPGAGDSSHLQAAIDAASNNGMGRVYIRAPYDTSSSPYNLTTKVTLRSRVDLVGIGNVRIVAQQAVDRMLWTEQGARGCHIHGIQFDGSGLVATALIQAQSGYRNFKITQCEFDNDGAASSADAIRIDDGLGAMIRDNDFARQRYAVRAIGSKNLKIIDNQVSEIETSGGLLFGSGGTSGTLIRGNHVLPHLQNVQGGHLIQFDGENQGTREIDIKIVGNTFEGNDAAYQPGVLNGAAADMIAMRDAEGWLVSGNYLVNPGEYGVTAVHGSSDGRIDGNIIKNADGAAILIGGPGNATVNRIEAEYNTLIGSGADRAGVLGNNTRAAIRVWNANDCDVWNNKLSDSQTYGLYVHSTTGAPEVTLFTHGDNRYSNSGIADFWDQGGGVTPIAPNWTAGTVI